MLSMKLQRVQRPAGQIDIARALGIGQSTVSRAFGAPGYITEELKAQVIATADRLGYRPNQGARAMRLGRFEQVVLVQSVDPMLSWMPHRLLLGIQKALVAKDHGLLVASFPAEALVEESTIPRTLREFSADGILVNYNTNEPPRLAEIIHQHRIPAVWINAKRSMDCVYPDDRQAGRLLAEYLLGLGHRRILYFDMHLIHTAQRHYSRVDRFAGWSEAMAAAGAEALELLPSSHILLGELAEYVCKALECQCSSAVVTYDAEEAAAVLYAALSLKWRIPADLSLACFHHDALYLGVGISAALSPYEEMGRAAAAMLLKRQAEGTSQPALALPYTLLVQGSTAGPAAR